MKSPVRTERESKREGFVSLTSALENTTVDPFGIEITTAIIQAAQRRGYIKPVDRELLAIARRLQKGQTQREIARQMGLTERQVQLRVRKISAKCSIKRSAASALITCLTESNSERQAKPITYSAQTLNSRKSEGGSEAHV